MLREKQDNRGPRKRTNKGRENDENRRLRGFIRASDSGKMGNKVENRCEKGINSFPRPKPIGFRYENPKGTVGGGPGAAGWRSGRRLSDNWFGGRPATKVINGRGGREKWTGRLKIRQWTAKCDAEKRRRHYPGRPNDGVAEKKIPTADVNTAVNKMVKK